MSGPLLEADNRNEIGLLGDQRMVPTQPTPMKPFEWRALS
jgi:hypothetical protein